MGFLKKSWRKLRPVRRIVEKAAEHKAKKWIRDKQRELQERENRPYFTTPIEGGERNGDGDPFETHVFPQGETHIRHEDLEAIYRRRHNRDSK